MTAPTDPLALRAQAVNHPAEAAEAAIRRCEELVAEIEALRAAIRDMAPIWLDAVPEAEPRHAATIARALEGRT